MKYSIQWENGAKVYRAFCEDYDSAVVVFEALADKGLSVMLWKGMSMLECKTPVREANRP